VWVSFGESNESPGQRGCLLALGLFCPMVLWINSGPQISINKSPTKKGALDSNFHILPPLSKHFERENK